MAEQQPEQNREDVERSILGDLLDLIESILCSVFLVFLVFTFLFRIATVEGASMVPTLVNGDRLIISELGYTPQQGDVVIINARKSSQLGSAQQVVESEGLNKLIVKRIIALGGQKVDIDFNTGTVTVDDQVLQEGYINTLTTRDEGGMQFPVVVPEGYVFVLGDNRDISKDSRHPNVGFVPESEIMGKALLRVFPLDKFGKVG